MSLPKLSHPIYSDKLPISGLEITYRPFLVSEEKILLMAASTKDKVDMVEATANIISACCLTPKDINPYTLPMLDVEYFFLKLRAKSVNNIIEMEAVVGEKKYPFSVDLEKLILTENKNKNAVVSLNSEVGLMMKPITLGAFKRHPSLIETDFSQADELAFFRETVEAVFDQNETYPISVSSDEQLLEFFNQFSSENRNSLKAYYEGLPKLIVKSSYVNEKNETVPVEVGGLPSFFTWA